MSDPNQPGQGSGSLTDVVTALQGITRQLSALVLAWQGRITQGSFTMGAAVSTVVLQPAVKANSDIDLSPRNAAAGTLQGSAKFAYVSAISPGISFTVTTSNGVAAAGTELFSYQITSTS